MGYELQVKIGVRNAYVSEMSHFSAYPIGIRDIFSCFQFLVRRWASAAHEGKECGSLAALAAIGCDANRATTISALGSIHSVWP